MTYFFVSKINELAAKNTETINFYRNKIDFSQTV